MNGFVYCSDALVYVDGVQVSLAEPPGFSLFSTYTTRSVEVKLAVQSLYDIQRLATKALAVGEGGTAAVRIRVLGEGCIDFSAIVKGGNPEVVFVLQVNSMPVITPEKVAICGKDLFKKFQEFVR